MYIMTVHLKIVLHKSLPSLCSLYFYVAMQGLDKNVTAAKNTHATVELLVESFSMWFVSYQRKKAISSPQKFLFGSKTYDLISDTLFCKICVRFLKNILILSEIT
jgi:hypothetical protein